MATAYFYDEILLRHRTDWGHPEKPARLEANDRSLRKTSYYKSLLRIKPVLPDIRLIELIHAPSYIRRVEREIQCGAHHLDSMDTMVCKDSYTVALQAVGGSLAMCDSVVEGVANNGFCAVRPPGHHGEHGHASGFCIFNNIAIAARCLQQKHGIKRVAIVDWDVHHGNGTQHAFESDKTVLYISLHQYPHFPGSGSASERGKGHAKGYTLNIPMHGGSGDKEYLAAFTDLVIPCLDSFKPDIVLISAGFDAHRADPLSSTQILSGTFGEFTRLLLQMARTHSGGRIISFLEGGYDLQALSEGVIQMMNGFVEG
jgi:acetoin utilization deacetylase AcuC-like enzyme